MKARASLTIRRSPTEVFAVLTDLTRLSEWRSSVIEASWLTEGPIAVGHRGRVVRNTFSMSVELLFEVTELEPDGVFSVAVLSGPVPPTTRLELSPVDEGTRIISVSSFHPKRGFRMVTPLVAATAQREEVADLHRLKVVLESEDGRPTGELN